MVSPPLPPGAGPPRVGAARMREERRALRDERRAARAQKRAEKRERRAAVRAERARQRKTIWEDARNLPNLLTFARIVMIPGVLVFLSRGTPSGCFIAAAIYSLAAITDFVDGYLARRQGLVSVLGKFLDPLADKLIVAATLVWLVPMGRIPGWAVVLLLSREITITALRSIASSEGLVIAAGDGGKVKTALQLVGILLLVLGGPYHLWMGVDLGDLDLTRVGRLLVYASLVYSLTSAASYMSLFFEAIEAERGGSRAGSKEHA
jgi:CDP-diacylglycerol--glycerol-3-phosphate 3-phosphatidyltransferase